MKKQFVICLLALSMAAMAETIAPPPPGQDCHDNLIYRKWNDLLFVSNSDGTFVTYQWYCDGQPISGATAQYLHAEGVVMQGDGHLYHATATTASGRTYICCAKPFEDFLASQPLNPASSVQRAVLYSATGRKMGEWETPPQTLAVPAGYYVWHITDEQGKSWTEKVLVQ